MNNPYEPSAEYQSHDRGGHNIDRHWLAALPCLLPFSAITLVYAVVILERGFDVRGAILNDFSTPMGTLFNVSAYVFVSALLWAPAGLLASIFLAAVNTSGRFRIWHPIGYVACCAIGVTLVFVDPGGVFTYYFD